MAISSWSFLKAIVVQDDADRSKQLQLNVDSSSTTNTKTTLKSAQTANRTLTLPDATDTLICKDTVDILTNKTIDFSTGGTNTLIADAVDIIYDNTSSGLTALDVQAAIDEVEGRVDTVETNISNHISDAIDAHDASAISNVPFGNLSATDVQAALNELQSDIDAIDNANRSLSNLLSVDLNENLTTTKSSDLFLSQQNATFGIQLTTANNGAGNSGAITLQTGTATGTRGDINLNARQLNTTGNIIPTLNDTHTVGSLTGNKYKEGYFTDNVGIYSGTVATIELSNSASVPSGSSVSGSINSGPGVSYSIQTTSASVNSGNMYIETGNTTSATTGVSGNISFKTGDHGNPGNSVNVGNLNFQTGNHSGSGNSGDITFQTGTSASGTRGGLSVNCNAFDLTNVTKAVALPTWHKYTVSETAFTAAATTEDIELFSLPAKGVIHSVIIKHTTSFTGGGLTAFTLSVGIAGNLNKYASTFDVFQATGDTISQASNSLDIENFGSATSIRLAATSTSANVADATAGSVDVYVLWGLLP